MAVLAERITIGELVARSGVPASALRYYETRRLITAERSDGNQRSYLRSVLRRVAFIRAAQQVGLSLDEIAMALEALPAGRIPRKADWSRLTRRWRSRLDERIAELERLRDDLTGCIGCGCLSLRKCSLLNSGDRAALNGSGARYLLGDSPPDG